MKKSYMSVWTKQNLFDPATIRKSTQTTTKQKIQLLFKRPHYSFDSSKDGSALTKYKMIGTTAFILDVKFTPPTPKLKEQVDKR